jgi:nicotinamidase-related amidase
MDRLTLDPATTALVLIDMQNDFCATDGFYARAGRDIAALNAVIAPIGGLLERARAAGLTIVYTRLVHDAARGPMEARHALKPKTWTTSGDRLIPGTPGAEVVDALAPRPGEIVIDKPGYSAFHDTDLEARLADRGVKTLLFAGVTTYACVLASAFAAFDRDLDVVFLTDMVASWRGDLDRAAFDIVDLLLGHAVPSDALDFAPRGAA